MNLWITDEELDRIFANWGKLSNTLRDYKMKSIMTSLYSIKGYFASTEDFKALLNINIYNRLMTFYKNYQKIKEYLLITLKPSIEELDLIAKELDFFAGFMHRLDRYNFKETVNDKYDIGAKNLMVIKDYQSLKDIVMKAMQENWPYLKFFDIASIYLAFLEEEQKYREDVKQKEQQANEELKNLPTYLIKKDAKNIDIIDECYLKEVMDNILMETKQEENLKQQENNLKLLLKINKVRQGNNK